jgi:multicomponent Na+:H+ antiporter subunit F
MIEDAILHGSLIVLVALLLPAAYRASKGPTLADRLLAIDLITTLLTGIIVLLALIDDTEILIDIGIALTALSFIATVSLTRYIAQGKVF